MIPIVFPYFVENICTPELSLDLFEKLNQWKQKSKS